MELILEVVSSERFVLGENAVHRFLPAGGVIGRSSECDWSIADQTRHLSGRHAIISYESGQFFITDISTNGIYLNGPEALPKNVAVALQDEDRLVMGEHQFRVSVQVGSAQGSGRPSQPVSRPTSPPPLGQGNVAADAGPMAALDAFVAERQVRDAAPPAQDWHRQSVSMPDNLRPEQEAFAPPKTQAEQATPPPPAQSGMLPDNWMDLSIVPPQPKVDPYMPTVEQRAEAAPPPAIPTPGGRTGAAAKPSAPVKPDPEAVAPPRESVVKNAQPQPPANPVPPPAAQNALLAAFAQGLGVSVDDIAGAGAEDFMQRAGGLLRQTLQGLVSSAQARASLKNEFRLDMTLVNPRANNPIKFSAHGDQVVRHLLARDAGSFMSVEDAVQECNDDFQQHQVAMMAGMQRAFLELIQQLSPQELEQRFDRLKSRGLSFSSKGSRYWEAYRELHRELQEEDDIFASMFAEPFARAYDEQIKKLKNSKKKG